MAGARPRPTNPLIREPTKPAGVGKRFLKTARIKADCSVYLWLYSYCISMSNHHFLINHKADHVASAWYIRCNFVQIVIADTIGFNTYKPRFWLVCVSSWFSSGMAKLSVVSARNLMKFVRYNPLKSGT
jgi:hypothetical protein